MMEDHKKPRQESLELPVIMDFPITTSLSYKIFSQKAIAGRRFLGRGQPLKRLRSPSSAAFILFSRECRGAGAVALPALAAPSGFRGDCVL